MEMNPEEKHHLKISKGVIVASLVGIIFAGGVLSGARFFINFVRAEIYQYSIKYPSDQPQMGGPSSGSDLAVDAATIKSNSRYELIDDSVAFPALVAGSYVVADIESGDILVQKNIADVYPIASVTKLMTALVSTESANQDRDVYIGADAVSTYGYQGNLAAGERIPLGDLLYPLLLESSNDTAEAIAIHNGRKFFIKNMNYRADVLGMADTFFEDPSGLSARNVSSAEDLLKLLQEINKNHEQIFDISREKDFSIDGHTWYNASRFLDDDNYVGGKNGYTDEALHTLITVFDLPISSDESEVRRIAVILLQGQSADQNESDTRRAILHVLQNFHFQAE